MDGNIFLLVFGVLCSAIVVNARKNAIIFFADDGGFMQTAYNNTVCDTPNLDALAKRSVTFTKGYTSVSSCSPSRSVLLTGLPGHQNGMYGIQHTVHHFKSFDNVNSLPQILSRNGIYTGIIGKYHVAPPSVYKFDYERINNVNQDGRNITLMKHYVRAFLQKANELNKPFFLYVAFFDPHRANEHEWERLGTFRNKWGNGKRGMGRIPDWKPIEYDPNDVIVPFFLPDTPTTRSVISEMYTTYNRMDQGIGLFMNELKEAGHLDDTMILFSSDNGIPFPAAKTNLYEPGMGEPMMISSPDHKENWGKFSPGVASTMDFTPTLLDWFDVKYPDYELNGVKVKLTGKSLIPLAANPSHPTYKYVYGSHNWHGITMYYPLRVLRTPRYRLIHNINWRAPYPLGTPLYACKSYQEIIFNTLHGRPTKWYKTLHQYYYRPEWELFDLENDPQELDNLAYEPQHANLFKELHQVLSDWLTETNDPFRCAPQAVLRDGQCLSMDNAFSPQRKEPLSFHSEETSEHLYSSFRS